MILVITDRYTKAIHLIPTRQTDTARELAAQFIHNVFRLHGLPDDIVSDRGSTFASEWWGEVCKQLGVKRKMSTAFHPQTDGQTERVHQSMERMLTIVLDYHQADWAGPKLDAVEFAYNNSLHTAINHTPFYLNHGYHPKTELSPSNTPTPMVPDAAAFVHNMHSTRAKTMSHLTVSRQRMLHLSATRTSPTPPFQVGDKVWLNAQHIQTDQPSKKLSYKFIGPYTILDKLGPLNFRLDLPSLSRHNVFHVDRLKTYYPPESFPHRSVLERPPAVIQETNEYLVSRILDSKRMKKGKKLFYLVTWEGYPLSDREWVLASGWHPDDPLVEDFRREHPTKETIGKQ